MPPSDHPHPVSHNPLAPFAALPPPLAPLLDIAYNLWWTWNPDAGALFERLDPEAWGESRHNPVKTILGLSPDRLDAAARDQTLLGSLRAVHTRLSGDLRPDAGRFAPAARSPDSAPPSFTVAYFCAEFGLTECFQIYCGGLGLLAGDHLKSASELGLPLVAVGLLYHHGYFHQRLDRDGLQHEETPDLDAHHQPIRPVIDPETGAQRRVHVELPGRLVAVGIWLCRVGSVPLYLLDTDLRENTPDDRQITRNLYLGDHHQRIKQEIVLGIGGVRALDALGERATVFHMNEGHAAFLGLERIRRIREAHAGQRPTFDQAREAAAAAHVFTTHTPLPAGIDRFHADLIAPYLAHLLPGLGLDMEGLMALGRENVADRSEPFSMAVLALRTARFCNGVSRLHGRVSRSMWKSVWPQTPDHDVPISHITNGVHARSWLAPEMTALYAGHLGGEHAAWLTHPDDPGAWAGVDRIPNRELWDARAAARERLVRFARSHLRGQLARQGAPEDEIAAAESILDPHALTIGFARRFAAYKRATLLFRHPERLTRLLLDPERPVQLVIAGKAHPGDSGGKDFIRRIVRFARENKVGHRVVFLEDYGIEIARHLVQGSDVWLNNPIRPLEASGTSGMKAALNGCVNASILDGWWDEGYAPDVGFAFGDTGGRGDEPARDPEARDESESLALYATLEDRIVPEFYRRDPQGLPNAWLARVKACIRALAPAFNTHRMVAEYARTFYLPAHAAAARLGADGLHQARRLADQIDAYRRAWPEVRIERAAAEGEPVNQGRSRRLLRVGAELALGPLNPDQIQVHLYSESPISLNHAPAGQPIRLAHERALPGHARHLFGASFQPSPDLAASNAKLRIRVLPNDDRLITPFIPGLVASTPLYLPAYTL